MSQATVDDKWIAVLRRYWGFDALRPHQAQAIQAALDHRDCLTVLPTGGGKSLCYQLPPMLDDAMDVVVSPLIALMKDQVDGLREAGYPAAAIHSGMDESQRAQVIDDVQNNRLKLLFVAPERLVADGFLNLLARRGVRRFAIDEAHCISQWGHDFRPEYRRLSILRQRFADASLHAFTATATPRVRGDIVEQLCLREPQILVGCFDRPNLIYRVLPKTDPYAQAAEALGRHPGEAAIVYCYSRKETESMADWLKRRGVKAAFYHAGMEAESRHKVQEAFAAERVDVIAATVAFGMGIDRSNVRCIVHSALPKTLEGYQQETGRAGRDGLEAECVLLYSAGDVFRARSLIDKSAAEAADPQAVAKTQYGLLERMNQYCAAAVCRHKALSEYFGQSYPSDNCHACDVCLDEVETIVEGHVIAQKILSCVARVNQRFGVGHVVDVLAGADTERIRHMRHHELSTYGLLKDFTKKQLTSLVYQLVSQNVLRRDEGELPVLKLNEQSMSVLRGQRTVRLLRPRQQLRARGERQERDMTGVDTGLFEALRQWRRQAAERHGIAPFMVFSDATLIHMARNKPADSKHLAAINGVGEMKLNQYGEELCALIGQYCQAQALQPNDFVHEPELEPPRVNPTKLKAWDMFDRGQTVEQVAAATNRAVSTTSQYLEDYILENQVKSIDAWVRPEIQRQIMDYLQKHGPGPLGPIFQAFGGAIGYHQIRIATAFARRSLEVQ